MSESLVLTAEKIYPSSLLFKIMHKMNKFDAESFHLSLSLSLSLSLLFYVRFHICRPAKQIYAIVYYQVSIKSFSWIIRHKK